jgi:uncharacterized protein
MRKYLRLSALALLGPLAVKAVDWKALQRKGCASDFAGVMNPASRQQLEAYCRAVAQATGVEMVFVTIPSLEGEPIDDVARTIFRGWEIGKDKGQGALVLLAIGERRSRLEVGDGMRAQLPGGLEQGLLAEMRPAVRRKQYGEAVLAAASTLGEAVARSKHIRLKASLERRIHPTMWDSVAWPVLAGALVLLGWLMVGGGTHGYSGYRQANLWSGRAGFLPGLASVINRASWGSRGSGGFGGYDSGDSFGGFGGVAKGQCVHPAPRGGACGDW